MEISRSQKPFWRLVGSYVAAGSSGPISEAVIGIGRCESVVSLCLPQFTGSRCAAWDVGHELVLALWRRSHGIRYGRSGVRKRRARDEVRFLRECTACSDAGDVRRVPGVERQDCYCLGVSPGRESWADRPAFARTRFGAAAFIGFAVKDVAGLPSRRSRRLGEGGSCQPPSNPWLFPSLKQKSADSAAARAGRSRDAQRWTPFSAQGAADG
jgi:hypothetical protein